MKELKSKSLNMKLEFIECPKCKRKITPDELYEDGCLYCTFFEKIN